MDGKLLIEKLLTYARCFLHLDEKDQVFMRNLLMINLNVKSQLLDCPNLKYIGQMSVPDVLYAELVSYALENNLAENEITADLLANYIFGLLTQKPSEINRDFRSLKEKMGADVAFDYFYKISIMNNYIKKTAIDKNIGWEYKDGNKDLCITINLSKPEKDNKDIMRQAKMTTSQDKYPTCVLCKENEGFYGDLSRPARSNLRTVEVDLNNEKWYLQYSPYGYFNEHCILFSKEHRPMQISRNTVQNLLDFLDEFPSYFISSNADLPIVGGSILNHEHYQGGRYEMPLHRSKPLYSMASRKYEGVEVSILDWYNSVVRLTSHNRLSLIDEATEIIEGWKSYSDETYGIVNSEEERHNTVSVMARVIEGNKLCVELILRNNLCTEEYPEGVYHAHKEYHNIKKEGIGIIEVAGLYILPGRLLKQIDEISNLLIANSIDFDKLNDPNNPLFVHIDMIAQLKTENQNLTDKEQAKTVIINYINQVCVNILDNTSVYKKDETGVLAFKKFLSTLSIV